MRKKGVVRQITKRKKQSFVVNVNSGLCVISLKTPGKRFKEQLFFLKYTEYNKSKVGSEKTRNVPEKEKSFKRLCVRFAEKTSMTGVPYINSARLTVSKITWTILLIGAIGAMIFHLYYLCNHWPKITKLTLQFSNLQLPEVTICNNNIIKKSQLHLASKQLQNYVRDLNPQKLGIKGRKKRFIPKLMDFNFSAYTGYGGDMFKTLNDEDDDADLGPDNEIVQIGYITKKLIINRDENQHTMYKYFDTYRHLSPLLILITTFHDNILNYSLLLSTVQLWVCDFISYINTISIYHVINSYHITSCIISYHIIYHIIIVDTISKRFLDNSFDKFFLFYAFSKCDIVKLIINELTDDERFTYIARPNGRPNRPNGRPNRPNGRPNRPNGRPNRPNDRPNP
ncbi:hypothetical protein KUTeg_016261 [Tegillarca granosa]|uniref:Uncharacterized protein n=1 Tax=Tegillarca granosa TaxID=220873 RepID=A0ABQ9EMW1_TEGGR|nr:hypothetical protein KUTeg_016261 [Tegillarca granosa]